MKSTFKKLWLFLAAAVMAFTTIIAVGCAKDDPADCSTAHSYGEWEVVKAPTETDLGDRKHTCTVCGNEEHEEIPMLESLTAAVNAPDLLKKGNGVNIVIDPFEFTNVSTKRQPVISSTSLSSVDWVISSIIETKYTVHSGYAYAGINDEGFLYAYGKVSFNETTSVKTVKTQETETDEVLRVLSFMLNKEDVYLIENAYTKNVETGEFTVLDEDYSDKKQTTIGAMLEEQDPPVQMIAQMVFGQTDKLLEFVNTDLRPFVEEVANSLGLNDEEAQKRALSMILKETKVGDAYVLVNRTDIFQRIADDFCNMTASKLIDKYCGEGTFAQIEQLPQMLDLTVGDVIKALDAKGVTLAKITAIADKAIRFATGDKEATLEGMLETDLATLLKPYEKITLGELMLSLGGSSQEVDYVETARSYLYDLQYFYEAESEKAASDEFDFASDWANFKDLNSFDGWDSCVKAVKDAYKAADAETYETYFGETCTDAQNVEGMVEALNNGSVFDAAAITIANKLNPNYGKTEEEIAAAEKAEKDKKIAEIKATMTTTIASLKTTTLPKLISDATEGETPESAIKLAINAVAAAFDKGISLKVTLDSTRTVTGYEMSFTKDLLALLGDMAAGSSSDGTTTVKTGLKFGSAFKLSVAFGAENTANKTDFNAEGFLANFPAQPETDGTAGNE